MPGHKHLPHLDEIWDDASVFFVTACTMSRRALLASEKLHAICREVWMNCEVNYGWRVGRYVLIPDHAHFFCWPAQIAAGVSGPDRSNADFTETSYKRPTSLSQFLGKWKEWTAKYAARRYGLEVPIWQPEYFDHLLRSSESYEQKWNYTRDNPVRAGLVTDANAWPYQGEIHKL